MIQQRTLLRAAPIALLFAISSCSTTDTTSVQGVDAGTGTVTNAPQDKPQDIRAQRRTFLVGKLLRDAEQERKNGNLELAQVLLLEAYKEDPGNREVQRRLVNLRAEMGLAPGTAGVFGPAMERLVAMRHQQALAIVTQMIQKGRQLTDELNFDMAIQQYRSALLRIDALSAMDWGDTESQVRNLLEDAYSRRTAHEVEMANAQDNEARLRLREAEAREHARMVASVNRKLELSQKAFIRKFFKESQRLASMALEEDANNILAKDLYNAATKAMRSAYQDRYYQEKSLEYLKLAEAREHLLSPQTELMRVDPAQWRLALERGGRKLPGTGALPEDAALAKRIREATVGPISFTPDGNGPYLDAYKLLDNMTKVPIIVSPDGNTIITDEDLNLEMNLVSPTSLKNLLDHMAGRSENLAWTIRNGVVVITTKAKAGGNNVLVTHDIRNLIFPITEFLPPSIKDIPTAEAEPSSPRTGGESDERVAYIELDALVNNLKSSTDPTYWDGESGAVIDPVEGGYLLVKANPEMQHAVAAFLDDMDRFSTAVVTIETKFLTLNENFLQEVGIDFRGTGGAGNKGTVAKLDDITNGADDNASRGLDNSGTADPAASPNSGFFYDDGGDGDFRGRSENFFQDNLGKILTPTGGLTAAFTFLNDLQMNMIFRAVEKNEHAQMVNAQTVTVLNNNRANVSVINQTSYVRDFDVEVAQASFIADPKIDVIHDGVVLDVRPIIRHDRRSVTLVLQPTVAELQRPIPQFTTSLAGSTLPVTLQLPVLTVRSFATTAQVPDGGTVLIGGLRTILSRERRAEIPILAKIPIISFFFKQEGVIDESSSLMVMVKAQITDVVDKMNAFEGK